MRIIKAILAGVAGFVLAILLLPGIILHALVSLPIFCAQEAFDDEE